MRVAPVLLAYFPTAMSCVLCPVLPSEVVLTTNTGADSRLLALGEANADGPGLGGCCFSSYCHPLPSVFKVKNEMYATELACSKFSCSSFLHASAYSSVLAAMRVRTLRLVRD